MKRPNPLYRPDRFQKKKSSNSTDQNPDSNVQSSKQPDQANNQKTGFRPGNSFSKPFVNFKKYVKRRPAINEVLREPTAGGVVYRRRNNQIEILMIQDAKDRWTIPKGHIEEGESPKETAAREVKEETGLKEVKVLDWLGKINFRYRRTNSLVLISQEIYLVKALGDTDDITPEDWMNGIKWFPASEAVDKIEYEDIQKLILLALKKIREN